MADNNNTPKNTLKQWFVTGAKPQQAQYWSWLDSYWHKSESIPINKIEGLETLIENKADVEELANYAKVDASNIGPNQGAWRTALGINDITPPDVDLSNYYTAAKTEFAITSKGYITSADLTGYATENWVSTQTTPATQAEVEESTGTESQPLSAEPTTENRKFLSLFNFFKLIKKLRYIHLLPNSATAVANRLRSNGSRLFYANNSAVESTVAYTSDLVEESILSTRVEITGSTTSGQTINLDMNAGRHFAVVLQAPSTLAITNMIPSNKNTVFTVYITGAFLETLPSGAVGDPYNDAADLSKKRKYTFHIEKGGTTPIISYSLINV